MPGGAPALPRRLPGAAGRGRVPRVTPGRAGPGPNPTAATPGWGLSRALNRTRRPRPAPERPRPLPVRVPAPGSPAIGSSALGAAGGAPRGRCDGGSPAPAISRRPSPARPGPLSAGAAGPVLGLPGAPCSPFQASPPGHGAPRHGPAMPPKFKRHLNDDEVTGSVKSERVSASPAGRGGRGLRGGGRGRCPRQGCLALAQPPLAGPAARSAVTAPCSQ